MALIDETPVDPTGDSWIAEHVKQYVDSGGKEGHFWQPGVPTLLLTTRGKKSGEAKHAAATTFLDDLKANLQALLTASNIKAPVTWSCISEDDEAQYEFKAVEYATKCAGHAAPTANIGMGSGSVQLVAYDAKNRYGACMPHSATACPCPISRGV